MQTDVLTLIQTISIVIGIIVGCGALLSRQNSKVADMADIKNDLKYIKDTLTDMKPIPERLVKVEQSVASAHKRIDEHIENHK